MEPKNIGRFATEMAKLSALADRVNDQTLSLEELTPLLEEALAQAALCDQLLQSEEGKVAATLKGHHELLTRLKVSRYYQV